MTMALLDRFKTKKASALPAASSPVRRPESVPAASKGVAPGQRRLIGLLIAPYVTEKTSAATARGWYTFRVRPEANKITITQAVGERYGVSVERVRIARRRSKEVRLGRIRGRSPGFKKAMVKVKAGQSIAFT